MNPSNANEKLIRVISQLSAVTTTLRLYLQDHPQVSGHIGRAYRELAELLGMEKSITIFLVGDDMVVNRCPLRFAGQSVEKFARILKEKGIERLTFEQGLSERELEGFVQDLASTDTASIRSRANIRLGKVEIRIEQDGQEQLQTASLSREARDILESLLALRDSEFDRIKELYSLMERRKQISAHGVDDIVRKFIKGFRRNLNPISLLATVKYAHEYTFTHVVNVCILTIAQAESLGFGGRQLHEIGIASVLHDVGKTFIPDEILSKPGALTPEERAVIETHPIKGGRYLLELGGVPKLAVLAAIEHHLRFDGSGYPVIAEDWKPNIVAQMIAISDVFDALRSRRSYSEPKPMGVIAEILRKERGSTFNPLLVDNFLRLIGVEGANPVQAA